MVNLAACGPSIHKPSFSADIVIVGAGLSGTLTAIVLGRAGIRVALADLHHPCPPDFRAEQLVGSQVEMLNRLGLLEIVVGDTVPADGAVATRAGRIVGTVTEPHYGIHYQTMVNRARAHLPPSVRFVNAKVVDIQLTDHRQQVRLSDGSVIDSRLVVLATGHGQRLLRQLGMGRTIIRPAHSLTYAFDLEIEFVDRFRASVLVAYGERAADCIDYLTIFSIGGKLRANLFTYGEHRDPRTRAFVQNPHDTLSECMPSLEGMVGRLQITGAVQIRVNDLARASGYCRSGAVLIGDTFQTSCPAAGTGIGRILNDVDRLCNFHIPSWLGTDGMNAEKISRFYDDPLKRGYDAEALRLADYRRRVVVETGFQWRVHRRRVELQQQARLVWSRLRKSGQGAGFAGSQLPSGASMAPMPLPQTSREKSVLARIFS